MTQEEWMIPDPPELNTRDFLKSEMNRRITMNGNRKKKSTYPVRFQF